MLKRMIFAVGILCLAACGPISTAGEVQSTSPPGASTQIARDAITVFGRTEIDDKTIVGLWRGADVVAQMSNLSLAAGFLTKGSPTALTVKRALIDLKKWLNVADEAQRAGNAAALNEAIGHAQRAYRLARGELQPGTG